MTPEEMAKEHNALTREIIPKILAHQPMGAMSAILLLESIAAGIIIHLAGNDKANASVMADMMYDRLLRRLDNLKVP